MFIFKRLSAFFLFHFILKEIAVERNTRQRNASAQSTMSQNYRSSLVDERQPMTADLVSLDESVPPAKSAFAIHIGKYRLYSYI